MGAAGWSIFNLERIRERYKNICSCAAPLVVAIGGDLTRLPGSCFGDSCG